MTSVLKSTPAQLRASKNYREKARSSVNNHMLDYYEEHKAEILRKKKARYHANKKKKVIKQLTELLSNYNVINL